MFQGCCWIVATPNVECSVIDFKKTWMIVFLLTAAVGCGEDGTDAPQDDPQMMEEPEPEQAPIEPVACDEDDLALGPFQGPGFDEQGAPVETFEGEYVVSTTFAIANDDEASQNGFNGFIGPIMEALLASEGLVGFSLDGSQKCRSGRTLTIWRDEASMMRFVLSPAHAEAMGAAPGLLEEARFARWTVAAEDMPALGWTQALEAIDKSAPLRYQTD